MQTILIPDAEIMDHDYCVTIAAVFVMGGRKYEMGISPEGRAARQTLQGPLVTEAFGWLNESATIIALHAIKDTRPVYTVEIGDVVATSYGAFEIVGSPRMYSNGPALRPIAVTA